jgi:hypothetical protein
MAALSNGLSWEPQDRPQSILEASDVARLFVGDDSHPAFCDPDDYDATESDQMKSPQNEISIEISRKIKKLGFQLMAMPISKNSDNLFQCLGYLI